jgi:predicted DNA-binding protein
MIRTQIYLTELENNAISRLSKSLGGGKSQIIRQAIDEFIEKRESSRRLNALREARGMWAKRKDLPDFRSLRESFDRF